MKLFDGGIVLLVMFTIFTYGVTEALKADGSNVVHDVNPIVHED